MSVESATYYQLLGLGPSATPHDIAVAYRREVARCNPDASEPTFPDGSSALARFIMLSAAYAELSDPTKRAQYDAACSQGVVTMSTLTFADAWKVFISFVFRVFVTDFNMGPSAARRVLPFIRSAGLLALGMRGEPGCVALATITLALTSGPEDAVGTYDELSEDEKTAFRMGVLLLARML